MTVNNKINKDESNDKRPKSANRKTPGFYYPEVVLYIQRKRQLNPRICEAELARSLNGNRIARYITKTEVREILRGLR